MNAQKEPMVRYLDQTDPIACPFGEVRRVITGGTGGIANVHVVTIDRGGEHYHRQYDETYFVLSGHGVITLDGVEHELRPSAVVLIPAGVYHSLTSTMDEPLSFVIFGTPPMAIDDDDARPRRRS